MEANNILKERSKQKSEPPFKKNRLSDKENLNCKDSTFEELSTTLHSSPKSEDEILSDITNFSGDSVCAPSKYVLFFHPNACCINLDCGIWEKLYESDFDLHVTRNISMLLKHPLLKAYHRAVLLDWLMEVSDLLKVYRETYYLALDYLDRFLSESKNVKRTNLQLVGLTCLFIAAKVEEVKPVTIEDLIYLTDSLYDADQLLNTEREILETINWRTAVWTSNKWLFAYLHVIKHVIKPYEYVTLTKLLDVATLDIESLQFSYSVIAATSIYLALSVTITLSEHSALRHMEVCECAIWMKKYWNAIKMKKINHPLAISSLVPTAMTCKIVAYDPLQKYTNALRLYKRIKRKELEDDATSSD